MLSPFYDKIVTNCHMRFENHVVATFRQKLATFAPLF
jgi:hypothetical protein